MTKNFWDVLISWNDFVAKTHGYTMHKWESADGAIHYDPDKIEGYPFSASVRFNYTECPDRYSLRYARCIGEYIEMSFSEEGELKSCYFHPGEEGYIETLTNIMSVLNMINYLKEETNG